MNLKNTPITVIAFETHPLKDKLSELLSRLGFKDIELVGYDDIARVKSNRTLIFLINQRKERWELMYPALRQLTPLPSLCLIPSPEKEMDDALFDYCSDFLFWPCQDNDLLFRLQRLQNVFSFSPKRSLSSEVPKEFIELNMIGNSPSFREVVTKIVKISGYDMPVLIEGKTGTGKEVAARAIHYLSMRSGYPFIPVNCGAIPDGIVESELFGHEKGAFTDAKAGRDGLISQAEGGTLFLDEIETFSPKGQIVLLRYLQDQQYRRLGSCRTRQSDVRIITASNASLPEMVEKGTFRQDLLFRLNIMSINIPPLCQRPEDIELLAEHFIDRYRLQYGLPKKYLAPETVQSMKRYHWPGNVRELENIIHRELLLASGPYIKFGTESAQHRDRRKNIDDRRKDFLFGLPFKEAKLKIVDQFENRYLSWLIKESNGNVTQAAKRAGKERRSLGKLLKKHGISKDGVSP